MGCGLVAGRIADRLHVGSHRASPQIWVMAADGSGPTQLTYDPTRRPVAGWSPDGETDRCSRAGPTSGQQVWSMAADGSDAREPEPRARRRTDSVWDGSWGPDGRDRFYQHPQPPPAPADADCARGPRRRDDAHVGARCSHSVIGLLVKSRPPFGGVAVALGDRGCLPASGPVDEWRFVPAAVVARARSSTSLLRLVAGPVAGAGRRGRRRGLRSSSPMRDRRRTTTGHRLVADAAARASPLQPASPGGRSGRCWSAIRSGGPPPTADRRATA